MPYVKIRAVYIDAGSSTPTFNIVATQNAIRSAWIYYISSLNISSSIQSIKVSMIDQNLYYDLKYAFLNFIIEC